MWILLKYISYYIMEDTWHDKRPIYGRSKSSEIWDLFASNSARHYHNSVPADPLRLYGCYGTVIGFYFEISSRRSASFPFAVLPGRWSSEGWKGRQPECLLYSTLRCLFMGVATRWKRPNMEKTAEPWNIFKLFWSRTQRKNHFII